jgi:hypothetical protein
MSELLWIAVPDGFEGTGSARVALLRLLILPRLDGGSLADNGMQSWPPESVTGSNLLVEFSETASTVASGPSITVPPPHIRAQPDLWQGFFASTTIVKPIGPRRRTQPPIEVRPTSAQAAAVKETVESVAVAPITPGASAQPAFDRAVRETLRDRWSAEAAPIPPTDTNPLPPFEPPDFHRTITMLREHPAVLRALGLIAEIRLNPSVVPAGAAQQLFVRVGRELTDGTLPQIVSPWTKLGDQFRPLSTDNISTGMVTLTDDRTGSSRNRRWDVATVDVDGATRRLHEAARAIADTASAEESADGGGTTARDATMPALRSAGLMLIRGNRLDEFAARRRIADANAARGSMAMAVFSADDLALGYRIDVKDLEGDHWRSLHQREATYVLRNGRDQIVIGARDSDEEGHLKAHAAVNDGSGTLRTDEVVARWNGWSLAVRRPAFDRPGDEGRFSRHSGMPFDFGWEFTAKAGSLPRLRFGHSYHLRARVADLCGGGLQLSDPTAERCFTPAKAFRRYEPISSPEVSLPDGSTDLGPSESAELIVIRSEFSGDTQTFAVQNPDYAVVSQRTVKPPRASLALAEQHGALDPLSAEDSWEIVKKALAGGRREGMTNPGEVVLPDFAAAGVFAFLRRAPDTPVTTLAERPWTGDWPIFKDKHIVLRERRSASDPVAQWQQNAQGEHELLVTLDKAEQLTIDLSSLPKGAFVDHFEIASVPGVSSDAVNQGRHLLVTPARVVACVHAVRRPLNEPAGTLTATRQPGQTFAVLSPEPELLNVDPKSTAQVDIQGAWNEIMDNLPPKPVVRPVQSIRVRRGDQGLADVLRHEFADTRHRRITYTVTAVSRFKTFFKAGEPDELFLTHTTLPSPVRIPSAARPQPPVVLAIRPAFLWEDKVASSPQTKQRVRKGGRLRVELERPWFQTGEGEKLAVIVSSGGVPPRNLHSFFTQIGRDPIWDTPDIGRWPTAAKVEGFSGDVDSPMLAEANQSVVVVPFDPWFDDDRWYADIALPTVANSTYCPFVELALARYQPDSLHDDVIDLRLSTVVRGEMVQILPDRTLTVQRSNDTLTVTLEGLGPSGPRRNRVDVILEQFQAPAGVSADAVDLTALSEPSAALPAWISLRESIVSAELGRAMVVPIPSELGPLRLRVREVELVTATATPPAPQTATGAELTEKVVFTDTVKIPQQ